MEDAAIDEERSQVAIGTSYFGNRIIRHVADDMADLAARGYTGVLHTMSENDLAYYRRTMKDIVVASHECGLVVQIGPWGLGDVFGGEAESSFVSKHPDACQVLNDGRSVAAGCLNNEAFRSFVRSWADAAIEAGADSLFWDEPHWAKPKHFNAPEERWGCRCEQCGKRYAERTGEAMPIEATKEVLEFRQDSMIDFLGDLVAHAASRDVQSTICLLPQTEGPDGLSNWEGVAGLPMLHTIATDPYWKAFGKPVEPFVGKFASKISNLADRFSVHGQIWIQGYGVGPEDEDDIRTAIRTARAAGIEDLWVWGFEACAHMSYLETREPHKVWNIVTEELTR
jgi:hypothetical protein